MRPILFAALLAGLVLLAGCGTTYPDDAVLQSVADAPGYVRPNVEWDQFPDGEDLHAFYPKAALYDHVVGAVRVSCDWDEGGAITACRVLKEEPAGYGFGAATIDLIKKRAHLRPADAAMPMQAGTGIEVVTIWAID